MEVGCLYKTKVDLLVGKWGHKMWPMPAGTIFILLEQQGHEITFLYDGGTGFTDGVACDSIWFEKL